MAGRLRAQAEEPIALVGSGCRFPGGASTPAKLWEILRDPRDLLAPIPETRFSAPGFYHEDGDYSGHSNVLHSYLLSEDHTAWDAEFFNIAAGEASAIDPQQRLLMECVYEALEAGGHRVHDLRGSDTAVYVGLVCEEYSDIHYRELNTIPRYFPTGTARSIASNRVSYFFDWRGPSMTIDTACSSSLVAVHQAVQALRSGVSKMAVAAGAQLILGPEPYIVESTFHMLSPSGRCRMWDASADGYGRGDGVAAVVLKTLSQAIADGDSIECIIREIGVNQDGGATSGITVPNPDAQTALIRDTYRRAGLDLAVAADRPQFFECHGTGTPTGDPLEATAIHEALGRRGEGGQGGRGPSPSPPLYVGSIKTVIGHTEATAGIAGLLKASLAVQAGLVPPNLLFDRLHPAIEPLYSGLEVPVGKAVPWPATMAGQPRRVSVNSFGFGGTNAHAIVESYDDGGGHGRPAHTHRREEMGCEPPPPPPPLPYTFSATTKASLARMLGDAAAFLEAARKADADAEGPRRSAVSSHALAWTLNSRRSVLPARAVFTARGLDDLAQQIRTALADTSWTPTAVVNDTGTGTGKETRAAPRLLGVFAGQGAQWAGMARRLAADVPFVARRLAELDAVLAGLPDAGDRPSWTLREELAKVQGSRVHLAEFAQPLCTALQIVQVDLLAAAGIRFAAVVGHSSGEMAAAYAAGLLSARDALVVAYYRGLCCASRTTTTTTTTAYGHRNEATAAKGRGGMMAVGGGASIAAEMRDLVASAPFRGRLCIAAHNSPTSVTLSGDEDAVLAARDELARAGRFVRLLRVDQAYHSHHMWPRMEGYVQALARAGVRAVCPKKEESKTQTQTHKTAWYSSVFGPEHAAHCLTDAVSAASTNTSTGDGEDDNDGVLRLLDGQYWALNMGQTVLFADAVATAVGAGSFAMAVGIGAHGALRAPLDEIVAAAVPGPALPYTSALTRNTDDSVSLLQAVGEIWTRAPPSAGIDLGRFQTTVYGLARAQLALPRDVHLPPYPWDHARTFWHESRRSRALRTRPRPAHPLLGTPAPDATPTDLAWHNHLRVADLPWLRGHRLQGQIIYPAAAYMASVVHAALQVAGSRRRRASKIELCDMAIGKAIVLEDHGAGGVELVTTLHLADGGEDGGDGGDGDGDADGDSIVRGFFRFRSVPLGSTSTDAPVNASGSLVLTLSSDDDDDDSGDNNDKNSDDDREPQLAPRQDTPALLVGVGDEAFYSSLDDLGYQYTDSFRSLSRATRKLGYAQAALAVPAPHTISRAESDLVLHPGTLDALFQAVFLAYAWPGDGRLWSMHVPVAVDRLQIDVAQVRKSQRDVAMALDGADNDGDTRYDYAQHYAIDAHITIDPSVSGRAQDGLGGDVCIYNNSSSSSSSSSSNTSITLVQAEGVRLAPLATASPDDDVHMFLENVDGVAFPDCALAMTATTTHPEDGTSLPCVDRASADETQLGRLLERIAHYYLARLARDTTPAQEARAAWHHQKLLAYARHAAREVAAGRMRFADAAWARDTDEGGAGEHELAALMAAHAHTVDVQLMRRVGEQLGAAVRGETAILQHMLAGGLLHRSYEATLGVAPLTGVLARVIAQIAHVYPAAAVLEIGAGTGGATKRILPRIAHAVGHYTFTDVSSGFFEAAAAVFEPHVARGLLSFRTLDIARDPVAEQGFAAHAYDVVLASFVLHATADLAATLRHARRLLRPGGFLVLLEMTSTDTMRLSMTMGGLEGWWLGADSGRPWSPCVSTAAWHALLRGAGFTGVEQSTPELDPLARPFAVLVSRALDARVAMLREPSSSSSSSSPSLLASLLASSSAWPIDEVLVVAGEQLASIRMGEQVAALVQPFVRAAVAVVTDGMKGYMRWQQQQEQQHQHQDRDQRQQHDRNVAVLYLADIDDRPLLDNIQPEAFDGLKAIFAASPDQMLWVTRGAQGGERPHAVASIGLGRALAMEYPQVAMQFVDFAQQREPDARMLADDLLRLRMLDGLEKRQRRRQRQRPGAGGGEAQDDANAQQEDAADVLWCREVEVAVDAQGRRWVSRILPHGHFNDAYNAARRTVLSPVDLAQDDVEVVDEGEDDKGVYRRSVVRVGLSASNGSSNNKNTIRIRPRLSVPLAAQAADIDTHDESMWHQTGRTWSISTGPSPAPTRRGGIGGAGGDGGDSGDGDSSSDTGGAASSVILLSDRLGSLVGPVTGDCVLPLAPGLDTAHTLHAIASNLVASLVAREAEADYTASRGTIDTIVLADPGVALARAVVARSRIGAQAAARTWRALVLTTSRATHAAAPGLYTLVDVKAGRRAVRASLAAVLGVSSLRASLRPRRAGTIVLGSQAVARSRTAHALARFLQSSVPELAGARRRHIADLLQDAYAQQPASLSSSSSSSSPEAASTALGALFCHAMQDVENNTVRSTTCQRSGNDDHANIDDIEIVSPQEYADKQRARAPAADKTATTTATSIASTIIDWSASGPPGRALTATARPLDGIRPLLRADRTYLLLGLGGAGGLGSSLAEYLVRQGARHIVLTSRHPGVDARLAAAYAQRGVRIHAVASDVAHEPSLRALVAGLRAAPEWPPIGGVANGAMVLADVSLQNMAYDELVRVLRPKMHGTQLVDALFATDPLDFFLLFSSLSCVLGNRGQANYDAANMFLVGLAAQRRKRGVVASVVDIGAIMGTGYMAREVKAQTLKQMVGAGFSKMSERDFYMAFAYGILAGRSGAPSSGLARDNTYEVITGLNVPPASEEFQPGWVGNPRFSHMVARSRATAGWRQAGSSSLSSSSSQAESTQQLLLRARTPSDVSRVLAAAIVKKLTHILQLSGEVADDHTALLERGTSALGVDSLVAVEIRAWMLREFEVDMPVFKILADTAIRDMVAFAVDAVPATVTPSLDREATDDAIAAEELAGGRRSTGAADVQKETKSPAQAPAPAQARAPEISASPAAAAPLEATGRGSFSSSQSSSANEGTSTSTTTNDSVLTPQSPAPSARVIMPPESKSAMLASSIAGAGPGVERSLPMSYGQSRFWFMSQLVADATACNVANDIEIRAELDTAALARAVKELGVRHEALRTAFLMQNPSGPGNDDDGDDGRLPEQTILKESPLRLETVEARTPADVDAHLHRLHKTIHRLETGELVRMVLVSLSPRRHHLLIGYHHINMDSASMAILLDELLRLYDGQRLPPPRVQQADLAVHQHQQQREAGRWATQTAFWRDQFAATAATAAAVRREPLPILSLSPGAATRARPERIAYRATSHRTRISAATAAHVQALCRRAGVTAFHLYTAVFQVLLARLARHPVDRVVIGMADANRSLLDGPVVDGGVGNFLNIVPLLLDTPPDEAGIDRVLRDTRDTVLRAMSNAAVPFEIILEQAQAPRSQSHSPVFQAFIDYKRVTEKLRMPGGRGEVEGKRYLLSKTPYDVMLDIIDTPQGNASLEFIVQDGLYTSAEGGVLLSLFSNLLDSFAQSHANTTVGEARLFDPALVDDALRRGQGAAMPLEQGSLVPRLFALADTLGNDDKNNASIALEDLDGGAALTWPQLKRKTEAIAHALTLALAHTTSQPGSARGTRVAVLQEPTADWVCTMLGIWCAGASYVPLEVAQGFERLRGIASAARVAAVVVHERTLAMVPQLQLASTVPIVNVSRLAEARGSESETRSGGGPGRCDPVVTGEDEAIVLYTSGSTGVPKGISVPHRVIVNAIDGMLWRWPELRTQPQTVLQQAALSFDLSWWTVLLGLCTRGTVIVASRDARGDPRQLTQLILRRGITFTVATPSETVAWLQSHDAAALRSCQWRWHVLGGEPVSLGIVRRLFSLHKPSLRVLNAYGPSETWMPLSHELAYQHALTQDDVDRLWPVPLGTVMPNYTVRVVDARGRVLPAGMPGQLVIGGAGVASGYVDQPVLTAQRFVPRGRDAVSICGDGDSSSNATAATAANGMAPSHLAGDWDTVHLSGDSGYLRAEDGVFMLLGRVDGDTQIKLRGLRIDLCEVEAGILATAHGDISDAVVSVRDLAAAAAEEQEATRFLAAHVVLSPSAKAKYGTDSESERERKTAEFLRGVRNELPLPDYMRPTIIIPVDALPLTPNGKLDRRAVSAWQVSLNASAVAHVYTAGQKSLSSSSSPSSSSLFSSPWTGQQYGSSNPSKPDDEIAKMRQIWTYALGGRSGAGLDDLGPHADFFHAGGNSILLTRVQSRLRTQYGISVPLRKLFHSSTLGQMAALLGEERTSLLQSEGPVVDWQQEIEPPHEVQHALGQMAEVNSSSPAPATINNPTAMPGGLVVALTGATGFLGRHLVQLLLDSPAVGQVHCLAVRNPASLARFTVDAAGTTQGSQTSSSNSRLVIHRGDLAKPDLGFEDAAALRSVFAAAHVLIHNAADTSFLKSYATLRPANVDALTALVRLTLAHRSQVAQPPAHIHFVSTTGVATFLGRDLGEEPLGRLPPRHVTEGYLLTKWVGEMLLEQTVAAARVAGVPLRGTVHRPTAITGPGAPELDVVAGVMRYSALLGAVPALEGYDGCVQFVPVEEVARGIVGDAVGRAAGGENERDESAAAADAAAAAAAAADMQYRNHCGDAERAVDLSQLGAYLQRQLGRSTPLPVMGDYEWIEKAEALGFPKLLGEYLRADTVGGGKRKTFRRLTKN